MLVVKNLNVKHNNKTIVKDINLHLNSGEKLLIFGKNGVGKTTLLKALCNIKEFESEQFINYEIDQIGYASSDTRNYIDNFTGEEVLSFFEQLNNSKCDNDILKINLWRKIKHVKCNEMSSGMKQLLKLAITFMENKNLIVWDEPIKHLDHETTSELLNILSKTKKTVIVSDHTHEVWDHVISQKIELK